MSQSNAYMTGIILGGLFFLILVFHGNVGKCNIGLLSYSLRS